jgi:hypothetical protein
MGILVPPGAQTVVVMRPRHLPWDLLPVAWDGAVAPTFPLFTRDEAAHVARRLYEHLRHNAESGCNPVETLGDERGFQVWVRTPEYFWMICRRELGKAYRPVLFPTREDALHAAEQLVPVVFPDADANQECYFNTQNFG